MIKPDETRMWNLIATKDPGETVRDVIARSGIHHKRCWALLKKWTDQGRYEYGVTLDLGWLVADQGRAP